MLWCECKLDRRYVAWLYINVYWTDTSKLDHRYMMYMFGESLCCVRMYMMAGKSLEVTVIKCSRTA